MIKKERLFTEDTINIFTDASISSYGQETVGCAGYIAVSGIKKISEGRTITRNTTNNISEITAVSLGVEFAIMILPTLNINYKTINLFSDSKICIFGLREWYRDWLSREYNGVLYNSSNKPVANQEYFNYIIQIILRNNLSINFYHQNGHVCLNSKKSLMEAMDTFKKSNYINADVDIELIKEISKFNDYIDNTTRDTLKAYITSEYINNEIIRPVYPNANFKSTFDFDKYKLLINTF